MSTSLDSAQPTTVCATIMPACVNHAMRPADDRAAGAVMSCGGRSSCPPPPPPPCPSPPTLASTSHAAAASRAPFAPLRPLISAYAPVQASAYTRTSMLLPALVVVERDFVGHEAAWLRRGVVLVVSQWCAHSRVSLPHALGHRHRRRGRSEQSNSAPHRRAGRL